MNSRERLQAALDHREPDRVPVDFAATAVTGIHVSAVHRLRQRLLGDASYRVKVIEPYQMLGEVDDALREALGIDVVGITPRKTMFGFENKDWKPFTTFDGTPCLVPGHFRIAPAPDGGWYIYPEGDTEVPPSGHMPKGGYFFDSTHRQEPIDESRLNVEDNLEEFGLFSAEDLAYYRQRSDWLDQHSHYGVMLVAPGAAFGDIALVPAPFLKRPKGIRGVEEWYMATIEYRDYVMQVFEKQCEIAEKNIVTLIDIFGDRVQAAMITGTDFGTQRGPFISPDTYRQLYQPFHRRVNDLIHRRCKWKTFIHSCGSVFQLLGDFVEAGFDILNPVQCSAAQMDPSVLKKQFGARLTFWGGGVDTQHTLPFGKPGEVYEQVRQRIEIFNEGGGFVFNAIHNIQGNTPLENILAMFKAVKDSAQA